MWGTQPVVICLDSTLTAVAHRLLGLEAGKSVLFALQPAGQRSCEWLACSSSAKARNRLLGRCHCQARFSPVCGLSFARRRWPRHMMTRAPDLCGVELVTCCSRAVRMSASGVALGRMWLKLTPRCSTWRAACILPRQLRLPLASPSSTVLPLSQRACTSFTFGALTWRLLVVAWTTYCCLMLPDK